MTTKTKVNLAKVIYHSYPNHAELPIDPDKDCKDLNTLYNVVKGMPPAELGDGLFRFIVIEAKEASEQDDGSFDPQRVMAVLGNAMTDIEFVINGIGSEEDWV